ncbi:MAG TPA: transglycosylase SLT domain-containing protein [Anaerolineaceae bacterium]|nr:transglycosylase SLT domain-containing protein [Anaerolineaceae bacterium]HPN53402.1 transglycosylase SLT domain-containing protein [Anaerolineaceae bacterium]
MRAQFFIFPGVVLGSMVVAWLGMALPIFVPAVNTAALNLTANLSAQVQPAGEGKAVEEASAQQADQLPACTLSERYPETILQWCGWIEKYAAEAGVPAALVASVMLQESGGDASAYSHSGAVGLMQVMPRDGLAADFQCANGPCFASRPTIEELMNPEYNIAYGTRMLASLINKTGNVREALFRYGPIDMGYSYADRVLAIWENYGD